MGSSSPLTVDEWSRSVIFEFEVHDVYRAPDSLDKFAVLVFPLEPVRGPRNSDRGRTALGHRRIERRGDRPEPVAVFVELGRIPPLPDLGELLKQPVAVGYRLLGRLREAVLVGNIVNVSSESSASRAFPMAVQWRCV